MKRIIFFVVSFMLFGSSWLLSSPKCKVIAHRGFWKSEGSAQNSISSLRAAINEGCYGSEFDVWVTKDGVAVVNHDATFGGVNIEQSLYEDVKKLRLANGEIMPTLDEYLAEGMKQRKTKLILELKSHSTPQRNVEAAQIVFESVKKQKATSQVEYITFNMDAGLELIRLTPRSPIAYLNGDVSPADLKNKGYSGLDYNLKVMRNNLNWFSESKKSKITINVWTVNDEKSMREMIGKGADFLTTDDPVVLKSVLRVM